MNNSLLIKKFLDEKKSIGSSNDTLIYYKTQLELFSEYINDGKIDSFTFINYQIWLQDKLNVKLITIQTYARAVKTFLRWATENRYINIDVSKLKLIKAEKEMIYPLDNDEIKHLLNSFDEDELLQLRNKVICMLMLDCGLRRGEIVKIKIKDINFRKNQLKVNGKGAKKRVVPFGKITADYLKRYQIMNIKNNTGYFFTTCRNTPITKNTIKMVFQNLKKINGLERIHAHLLRHTFATNFLLDGGDIEILRILMGHDSISTTQKYVHIAQQLIILNDYKFSHLDKMLNLDFDKKEDEIAKLIRRILVNFAQMPNTFRSPNS